MFGFPGTKGAGMTATARMVSVMDEKARRSCVQRDGKRSTRGNGPTGVKVDVCPSCGCVGSCTFEGTDDECFNSYHRRANDDGDMRHIHYREGAD